jgi:hypothetical protein
MLWNTVASLLALATSLEQGASALVTQTWASLQPAIAFLNANPAVQVPIYGTGGVILTLVGKSVARIFSIRSELKQNRNIRLDGQDWFAAWQAAADDEEVINIERLVIKQRGSYVSMHNKERSPDNPKGGYRWKSRLEFSFGETLMGWYFPIKKENITNRGMMFFAYDAQRKVFHGKWVGKAIDGVLCTGFVAIAKSPERARRHLDALIERSKTHPINILSATFLDTERRQNAA